MLKDFGQVLTAMVTPFTPTGEINYQAAEELALMLIKNGSDALVVAGTTGEGPVLSEDEKIRLFSFVKEVVGDKALGLAGTGNYDTAASVKLSQRAEAVGVDGVMLVVPYYNKPSQEGLYQHFKIIAESIKLPILLYNVPSRTSKNLEPATVKRLSEIKNIIALKEAACDLDQASELCRVTSEDFLVYSGDDSYTLPILSVGGHGVVSVAAHLVGKKIKKMITDFKNGDVKKATATHLELFPLIKSLFMVSNPVPVKEALQILGYKVGEVKLPLVPLTAEEKSVLFNKLKEFRLV